VRPLDEDEFAAIIDAALPADLETREARRYGPAGFDDAAAPFARPVIERLTQRPYRDAVFRRKVLAAYDERCAISGLRLTNGGGRPEVQAAHIRPVEHHGSDRVGNGLALSATLHWMFDRGLIGVAEDHRILVSHNNVDADTRTRLFRPDMRLALPADRRNHPHPVNLAWRREHIFGQAA
jgi:putative restriction endonuclease